KQKTGRQHFCLLCKLASSRDSYGGQQMTLSRAPFSTILLLMVAPQPLRAEPLWPLSGSYEITARLELPHLERWGVDKIASSVYPTPVVLTRFRCLLSVPIIHSQNALRLIS